jgi:UDP-glucose:(heptosyl)LPS alpha-1,3-glucosyltransferase
LGILRIALSHHRLRRSGGIEGYVWELARRLAGAGHHVQAFVRRVEAEPPPGVGVHLLGQPPLPRALDILHFAAVSAREIRAGGFDIVHGFGYGYHQDVYTEGSCAYADFLAATLPTRPERLGRLLRRFGPQRRVIERIERRRYGPGGARRILAMSELSRASVVAHYPHAAGRTEVAYVPVDLDRFAPERLAAARTQARAACGILPSEAALLFVGSDYGRKGLGTLLGALARLRAGGLAAKAIVVGAEKPRRFARFRALARALGIAEAVRFVGPQAEVAPFFAAGDVFVFPSRFDAFGMVVLEAMAAGLPAVVSARAGASECVRPGETGAVLADPEDEEAAAAAIARCLADGARARFALAARREAAHYSWDAHLAKLDAVYEAVVAERRAARSAPPAVTSVSGGRP